MGDVATTAGRVLLLGAGLLVVFAIAPLAEAQGLSEDAAEALRQGQRTAARAMTQYPDHYPDQPLWREAISLGEQARRLAPERGEPYRFLGQVYSVTGWYSRAWNAWQAYRQRAGELDAQARTQLLAAATWLGFNSFSAGHFDRAVPYLEEALRLNPEDRLTLTRLAQAHIQLGEPQAAKEHAETLARLDPGSSELLERVETYLTHGREAVDALYEGESLYAAGRLGQSLERFESALESSPDYREALRWAGRVALEIDRPGAAARHLERLVELEPADDDARSALSLARNRERYGTEAYAAYREGLAAYGRGERNVAARRFQEALSRAPQLADAHARLGRIQFERGEFEESLASFREAIRLDPNESSYRFFLSTSEDQLRRLQEARAREEEAQRAEQRAEELAQAETEARAQAEAEAQARAAERAQVEAEERAAAEAQAEERAAAEAEAEERAAAEAQAQAEERAAAEAEERARAEADARAQTEAADRAANGAPAGEAAQVAAVAPAQQPDPPARDDPSLVVLDASVAHVSASAGGAGAFSFLPGGTLNRDLTAPVDYSGGTLYQRLEVLAKPSDLPVHYQLCLVPNDAISVQPACSASDRLVFQDEGVFEAEQPVQTLSGYGGIDWSHGMESIILVIKDPSGVPVDNRYLLGDGAAEPPDPALYYPMEVRYTAILVAEGNSFPGWPD